MSHETADPTAVLPDDHWRPTYEDIHIMIRQESLKVREEFEPDLMVAIGGGGFFPARVLRTFLRKQDKHNPGTSQCTYSGYWSEPLRGDGGQRGR